MGVVAGVAGQRWDLGAALGSLGGTGIVGQHWDLGAADPVHCPLRKGPAHVPRLAHNDLGQALDVDAGLRVLANPERIDDGCLCSSEVDHFWRSKSRGAEVVVQSEVVQELTRWMRCSRRGEGDQRYTEANLALIVHRPDPPTPVCSCLRLRRVE